MTYEVHIEQGQDFLNQTVSLIILERSPNGITFVSPDGTRHWQAREDGTDIVGDFRWGIPVEALHPLLAALSRHLGAVEHPEQLRSDYMAERKRVDKLIDSLIGGRP